AGEPLMARNTKIWQTTPGRIIVVANCTDRYTDVQTRPVAD
ncbi:MAG: hypothetical protein JWM99_1734, partial [Verrucomicrobiales bacterium]|nr:hypothetical protein [Verrucomicrobiales bacterium]